MKAISTTGWAQVTGFSPGDKFTLMIPMYPKWARFMPRWTLRFIPKKDVLHYGEIE